MEYTSPETETIIQGGDAVKKRRGRRKKTDIVDNESNDPSNTNIIFSIEDPAVAEQLPKKRGRKPKGGKIISKLPIQTTSNNQLANIILHLRCSISDLERHSTNNENTLVDPLEYVPIAPPTVSAYLPGQIEKLSVYNDTSEPTTTLSAHIENTLNTHTICSVCKNNFSSDVQNTSVVNNTINNNDPDDGVDVKELGNKLKQLKIRLYKNTGVDKKSACFWCTYDYDNPPCYIPKHQHGDELIGYGSFCRPECAVAYLMKENIDDSAKFERYQLLNKFYGKVYNYMKNIKPSPDPHFLLDKFYGNMSIQEYRKLLGTDHMLLVVEKPMTRILPELHDDIDDSANKLYGNNQNAQTGVYKVKRQSEKQAGPTKSNIMKEKFGLA
jgi:hypothetical protein